MRDTESIGDTSNGCCTDIVGVGEANFVTMLAGATDTTGRRGIGCTIVETVVSLTNASCPGMTIERFGFVCIPFSPAAESGKSGVNPVCSCKLGSSHPMHS